MFEVDERYLHRQMIINKQIIMNVTKEKLKCIYESKIMFIEDSNEGIIYLMDILGNLLCIKLGKDIKREDLYEVMPEYISYLMWHNGSPKLGFQSFKVVQQGCITLGISRMHLGLHTDEFLDNLNSRCLGKV